MRDHPYADQLRMNSDYGREIQDEMRAEQARRPRTCAECACTGGHNAGCPADEDYEDEEQENDL